jgi:methyl-accepting chemotaxis protein
MKNSNENMDDKMKEIAGDSEEILQILKTINNIVDCKNKIKY